MYSGDVETGRVLRQLVEQSPEVLWAMSADWDDLLFVTDNYEDLWGRPVEGLVEDPTDFLNAVHPEDRERVLDAMGRVSRGTPAEVEIRVNAAEEFGRWAWIRGAPVYEGGELTRVAGFARDVTEREESARRLEAANEELEHFADVLAHDLRNPLSVARGSVDLVEQEVDSEMLGMATDALERMDTIITEVLETTTARDAVADTERIDLASFAVEHWRYVPTESATLSIEGDRRVQADRELLSRLFENLFGNAVEHSSGPVTITVGATETGFYIADDGDGLPADGLDLFERGVSASDDGLGLGLAIVRRIVDAHDWSVEAGESADGGARFDFGVPGFAAPSGPP